MGLPVAKKVSLLYMRCIETAKVDIGNAAPVMPSGLQTEASGIVVKSVRLGFRRQSSTSTFLCFTEVILLALC